MTGQHTPPKSATRQARRWYARLEAGEATAAEENRFQQWLDADPAHRHAFVDVDDFCRGVQGLQQLVELDTYRHKQATKKYLRRPNLWQTGGLALAGLVLAIGLSFLLDSGYAPIEGGVRHSTQTAEISNIELEDGSSIDLGPRTQIAVHYNNDERTVQLLHGEAFFSVVADENRPFIVRIDDARVRVVGTQFNVRANSQRFRVSVAEGVVDVSKPKAAILPVLGRWQPQQLRLVAGQQVGSAREAKAVISSIQNIDPAQPGRWRSGLLVYRNTPLRDMIEDIRRYTDQQIRIIDPQLGDLTLTVSFRSEQVNSMLNALPQLLPVSVEQALPGVTVIKQSTEKNP